MQYKRLARLVIILVSLLLLAGTASAVVIQNNMPANASAADNALFNKVKTYLEKQLKDCQQCNFTVTVENGQVRLSGVAPVGSLPHLKKIKRAVGGIKGLNLDKVQFNPQPHPRSRRKDTLEMRGFDPQPHPGSRGKDALEMRGLNPQPEPPGKEK